MKKKARLLKTAAILIKVNPEKSTYVDALRRAREKIKLEDLGIENTKIKVAANGGRIIEIPGCNNASKADTLKEEISRVLGDSARVTRPQLRAEIMVTGFDDFLTEVDLADALAERGCCAKDEIKVSNIKRKRMGPFKAWVSCPVPVAKDGELRIGWIIAKVKLIDRPVQCFKCWGFGHVSNKCSSVVNRKECCFKCGETGHAVKSCKKEAQCVLCKKRGVDFAHRMGAFTCRSRQIAH